MAWLGLTAGGLIALTGFKKKQAKVKKCGRYHTPYAKYKLLTPQAERTHTYKNQTTDCGFCTTAVYLVWGGQGGLVCLQQSSSPGTTFHLQVGRSRRLAFCRNILGPTAGRRNGYKINSWGGSAHGLGVEATSYEYRPPCPRRQPCTNRHAKKCPE